MGRRPKFTAEQVLDAAADIVASAGPGAATVATISERLGATSGSIYHRFASRDLILAHLWIRTVRRAQDGFLNVLSGGSIDAAVQAALHVPRWSRDHLPQARILVLYRREDLAARWPDELGAELAQLNDGLLGALCDFTHRRYGQVTGEGLEAVTFALIDVPYAAVRRHLIAGTAPPRMVDDLVQRVVAEVLANDGTREY